MPPTFSTSTSLLTEYSVATARELVEHVLVKSLGGRPQVSSDGWQTVAFGSAFELRMLGLWSKRGERRLPLSVSTLVRALEAGSAVDVHIRSTEGPYLFVMPYVETAYRRVTDRLLAELARGISVR